MGDHLVLESSDDRVQYGRRERYGGPSSTFIIGLLLGVSSAVVGIPYGILEFRVWHLLLFAAASLAVLDYRARFGSVQLFPHDFAAIGFVLWGLLAEFVNSSDLQYPFRPALAIVGSLFLLAYWTARLAVRSVEDATLLLKGLIIPSLPVAIIGAAQAGSAEVSRWVLQVAPAEGLANRVAIGSLIKATATIGHWTGLGFYFCAILAANLILLSLQRGRRVSPWVAASIGGSLIGVFSSLTIAAIVTAAAILLSAVVVWGRIIGPSVGVVAVVAVIWYYFRDLLDERIQQQFSYRPDDLPSWVPNTIAARVEIWREQTIPVALERSFWGWGSGIFSSERERPSQLSWNSAESQWLAQMLTAGLISTILLVLLIGAMLYTGWKLSAGCRLGRSAYPFLMLIAMTFGSSFTAPVYINRGLTIPLWILFGLLCALLSSFDRNPKNPFR